MTVTTGRRSRPILPIRVSGPLLTALTCLDEFVRAHAAEHDPERDLAAVGRRSHEWLAEKIAADIAYAAKASVRPYADILPDPRTERRALWYALVVAHLDTGATLASVVEDLFLDLVTLLQGTDDPAVATARVPLAAQQDAQRALFVALGPATSYVLPLDDRWAVLPNRSSTS